MLGLTKRQAAVAKADQPLPETWENQYEATLLAQAAPLLSALSANGITYETEYTPFKRGMTDARDNEPSELSVTFTDKTGKVAMAVISCISSTRLYHDIDVDASAAQYFGMVNDKVSGWAKMGLGVDDLQGALAEEVIPKATSVSATNKSVVRPATDPQARNNGDTIRNMLAFLVEKGGMNAATPAPGLPLR